MLNAMRLDFRLMTNALCFCLLDEMSPVSRGANNGRVQNYRSLSCCRWYSSAVRVLSGLLVRVEIKFRLGSTYGEVASRRGTLGDATGPVAVGSLYRGMVPFMDNLKCCASLHVHLLRIKTTL
jgi:hypothetical protein